MKLVIPSQLLAEKTVLLVPPDLHEISYLAPTWSNLFSGDNDFNELTQKYPSPIKRVDIFNLVKQIIGGSENARKVFLATMLWGYGTIGYGAYRTKIMLSDQKSTEIIQETFALVSAGNYLDAYKRFELPRCGAAFLTKYFYFVGWGSNTRPMPLILDSVVANSLSGLGIDISLFVKVPRSSNEKISYVVKWAEGYVRYVEMVNEWAAEMGCRPDSIEKWLFMRKK
jgi:hypothetical protein